MDPNKHMTNKLTVHRLRALKRIAEATDKMGGLVVKRATKPMLDLVKLGLVQSGHHESARELKSGNLKITMTPAFRINKKGRTALASAESTS